MATMICKQVYLEPRQDLQIKRLAKERGTTEAEIIREAIDLLLSKSQRLIRAQDAWEAALTLMEMRAAYATRNNQEEKRTWTREELYEGRLSPHEQDPD